IALRQRGHDTTGTRIEYLDLNLVTDRERPADPAVFDESVRRAIRIDDHIWPEAPDIEAAGRAQRLEAAQRRQRQQMKGRVIEERPGGRRAGRWKIRNRLAR